MDFDPNNPYGFISQKYLFFLGGNVLTYEGSKLLVELPYDNKDAQRIVDLLNLAYGEGYNRARRDNDPELG